jgi:hypothetical protein
MNRAHLKTIDDEDDPLMRAIYELQNSLESAIESLKMERANFANAVAILQERQAPNRSSGSSPISAPLSR